MAHLMKQIALTALICGVPSVSGCRPGTSSEAQRLEPLISPGQIEGDAIPQPLADHVGSPPAGQLVFTDRESGHCTLCHRVADLDEEFQGNVGPDLSGIGDRLTTGQLRLRIADISAIMPHSVMPSYYRVTGLNQVKDGYQRAPILSSTQIEDLVAYLASLKDQ